MRNPDGEPWTLDTFTAGVKTTARWSVRSIGTVSSVNRLDAEYYHPDALKVEQRLLRLNAKPLGQICDIQRGITPQYSAVGVPIIRSGDLSNLLWDNETLLKASPNTQDIFYLKAGDVLISSIGRGSIGKVAVFLGEPDNAGTVSEVTVLRNAKSPFFLFFYLRSRAGQILIEREVTGATGQLHLNTSNVARILVPELSQTFDECKQTYLKAIENLRQSKALYAQAESLLLTELGLDDLDLSHRLTYTQDFSQVWAAGRLDAEYFQPKYYALLDKIQRTGQAIRLGDWLKEPIRRGIQPEYDENGLVIVINSQHVGKTYIELEDNRHTTQEFAEQNKRAIVHPYDVLLNSTGYITIGRCQALLDDVPAIVDGHISIIRPKPGLDPVYLSLFLNSPAGQMQTERNWTGSSGQIELRSKLVENYIVWKPDKALQRRIRNLVENAHKARLEAKRLLEEARQRVEAMILG